MVEPQLVAVASGAVVFSSRTGARTATTLSSPAGPERGSSVAFLTSSVQRSLGRGSHFYAWVSFHFYLRPRGGLRRIFVYFESAELPMGLESSLTRPARWHRPRGPSH